MSFDWTHYLELAECIFGQKENLDIDEEAICRCAVSRAYYAAFCYSRNMAEAHMLYKLPSNRNSVHDHLINFFKNQMGLPSTGGKLARLREWRTACDYDDVISKKYGSILYLPNGAFNQAHEIMDHLNKRYLDSCE
jgi:hypothetical protein